jgi:hypothetical protein
MRVRISLSRFRVRLINFPAYTRVTRSERCVQTLNVKCNLVVGVCVIFFLQKCYIVVSL